MQINSRLPFDQNTYLYAGVALIQFKQNNSNRCLPQISFSQGNFSGNAAFTLICQHGETESKVNRQERQTKSRKSGWWHHGNDCLDEKWSKQKVVQMF